MTAGPLVPLWFGVPAAAVTAFIVVRHLRAVARADAPASRRRIRQANGGLMLVTIPTLLVGFCVVDHEREPGAWAVVWLAAMALLGFVVFFAVLDVLNTLRLRRRRARRMLRGARALSVELARRRAAGDGRASPTAPDAR